MIDQLELKQSTIRPWRLDDAESLARHANDRKVWLSLRDNFPHPYTTEDAYKFLEATVGFEPITIFVLRLTARLLAGLEFIWELMCIGALPNWATGLAWSSGHAAL